jgi:hypothetical protein
MQDEHGAVTRNKVRLVVKGYSQVECLNFDETFAPVARLESIHMLLANATHHGFKLYQMSVNSIFLNGPIKEEVYVEQPPGFESEGYPNHVYKLQGGFYMIGPFRVMVLVVQECNVPQEHYSGGLLMSPTCHY